MRDRTGEHRLVRWWNRVSLRTKITGVTVLLLTLGLLVAGVGSGTVLRNYVLDEVDAGVGQASSAWRRLRDDALRVGDLAQPQLHRRHAPGRWRVATTG